jgi:cell wall-associated NlpC family hydrolase
VSDAVEHARGTDPLHADTDHDGILDGVDMDNHTPPGVAGTMPGDPLHPGGAFGTDPLHPGGEIGDPLHPGDFGDPAHPAMAFAPAVEPAAPAAHDPTADATHHSTQAFLDAALAQTGDPYVWGAEASAGDPNPKAFDCSELAQWAAARVGITLPDGSWLQYLQLKDAGAVIPVDQAIHTPGALLFNFSSEPTAGGGRPGEAHVAISLGDGKTIEARGVKYGVGSFEAAHRFDFAAVLPGLSGPVTLPDNLGEPGADHFGTDHLGVDHPDLGAAAPPPAEHMLDADHDGIPDAYEMAIGTDPHMADSDHDGLTDGFEVAHHLNPLMMDTDHDGLSDAFEVQAGLDPNNPDSNHNGIVDGYEFAMDHEGMHDFADDGVHQLGVDHFGALGGDALDSDHDGLADAWEHSIGTDPFNADSDHDGISDALEVAHGTDPMDHAVDHAPAELPTDGFDMPEP